MALLKPNSRETRLYLRLLGVIDGLSFGTKKAVVEYITRQTKPTSLKVQKELAKALKAGGLAVEDLTIERLRRMFEIEKIPYSGNFKEFASNRFNALIAERRNELERAFKNSVKVMENDFRTIDSMRGEQIENLSGKVRIGRRLDDSVRAVSIREIEKALLKGSATTTLLAGKRIGAGKGSIGPLREALKTVSKDGKTITIVTRPYNDINKTQTWDINKYAELVALTTVREAEQEAHFAKGDALGTEFVKYPKFNKDYKSDPVCARINGKVFSRNPNGSFGASGKFYPYLYDPNKGLADPEYRLAHPHCRHIARPIPGAVV